MEIIKNNGRLTVSFSSNIRAEDRITIPHNVREKLLKDHDINLNNGMLVQATIKNHNKMATFISKVIGEFRIKVPTEEMKYHKFNVGDEVDVQMEIDRSKLEE